jgi:hypothetical protein
LHGDELQLLNARLGDKSNSEWYPLDKLSITFSLINIEACKSSADISQKPNKLFNHPKIKVIEVF